MNKPLLLASLFLFLFFSNANAQEKATNIGILPFDVTSSGAAPIKDMVQEQVTTCFVNKSRFYLLDRSVTEKLKAELERAKENSSAYAKIVADQGHMAGAQYLMTGKVSPLEYSSSTSSSYLGKTTTYHAVLRLSLQINAVETGKVIFSQPIDITSNDFSSNDQSGMLTNILCKTKGEVQKKVRGLFPGSEVVIIGSEMVKKDMKILINAGKETFDKGKDSNCGVTISNIFSSGKIALEVVQVEEFTYGTTTSKREKVVGKLKIDEVQGDISTCSITKGEKEIKALMDEKKPLIVRVAEN